MGSEALRYCCEPSEIEEQYYATPPSQCLKQEESEPTEARNSTTNGFRNTRDMFGSDYFSSRPEDAEECVQKKSSIRKKEANNCASHLRMNKVVEINCPQLSE